MNRFSFGLFELGNATGATFADFVETTKGRSIVSAADWGDHRRVEIGLSAGAMLRIFWEPDGLHMNVVSTLNAGEIPPVLLDFPAEQRRASLRLVEQRLAAIRDLHAIFHLLESDRAAQVVEMLATTPAADLCDLLEEKEQLYVETISPGSWVVTLWTTVKASWRSLLAVALVVFPRTQDAFLRRLEAETRLRELDVADREFLSHTAQIDYVVKLATKLPAGAARNALKARIDESVRKLAPAPALPSGQETHTLAPAVDRSTNGKTGKKAKARKKRRKRP